MASTAICQQDGVISTVCATTEAEPAAVGRYNVQSVCLSNELPEVYCLEPLEAQFLYQQVHAGCDYLQHGINIRPGDTVMDVGGNIGMFGLHTLLLTGGDVKLFVFEPVPVLAHIAAKNIARYSGPGTVAKIFECGLTSPAKVGTCSFNFMPQYSLLSSSYEWVPEAREAIAARLKDFAQAANCNGDGSGPGGAGAQDLKALTQQVNQAMQGETVTAQLRTFADVRATERIDSIDLLKVDVEQAELDVLLGLSDEDWAAVRQLAVEVHLEGDRLNTILDLLRHHGFTNIKVGEASVPKYLGFKEFGVMDAPADQSTLPAGEARGAGLLCNVFATR